MILGDLIGVDCAIIEAVHNILSGQGGFNSKHIEMTIYKSITLQYFQLFGQREEGKMEEVKGLHSQISQRGGQGYLKRRTIVQNTTIEERAAFKLRFYFDTGIQFKIPTVFEGLSQRCNALKHNERIVLHVSILIIARFFPVRPPVIRGSFFPQRGRTKQNESKQQ